MKSSGSLRLSRHHHDGQTKFFVESSNQVGLGSTNYDRFALSFGRGELLCQSYIARHVFEQRKQTR